MHWPELTNKQKRFLKTKTVETGLSDFHKMVVSVFKTSFKKQKPKIVTYRDYKCFDNEKFRESLLIMDKNISYDTFENLILQTLGKMAPIKQNTSEETSLLSWIKIFIRL